VNLDRWATEFDVETGVAAGAVAWLADRTLVAGLLLGGIVLIDPVTGTVTRRWAGWAALDAAATRTRRRFVMLERGGRTRRLATVDAQGRLRSVSVRLPVSRHLGRRARPALVADPAREHAYVLTGSRVVLDVDLRRMRVRRHRLEGGQPRPGFPVRGGLWLGGGRLATYPAGLSTVDTRTWKVETVDSAATGAALAPRRLLAFGERGVRGYTRGGRRVFEALQSKAVWHMGATGRLAYAGTDTATFVIDTRSGRVMRRIPRPRELLGVIARRCPRSASRLLP
jgi:hypothetical protein